METVGELTAAAAGFAALAGVLWALGRLVYAALDRGGSVGRPPAERRARGFEVLLPTAAAAAAAETAESAEEARMKEAE